MKQTLKAALTASFALLLLTSCGKPETPAASASSSAAASVSDPAASSAAESTPVETPDPVDRLIEKTYTDDEGHELLRVSVVRPDLSQTLDGPALRQVDAYYAAANEAEAGIWQELADFSADAFVNDPDFAATYLVDEDYRIAAEGEGYVSVVRTVNEWTGGAHDNTYVRPEVFRRTTGERLALRDLFAGGKIPADELHKALMELARPKVESGEYYAADEVEYILRDALTGQSFYLTEEALVFVFSPYELAPFAAGTQELPVPVTGLTGFAAP